MFSLRLDGVYFVSDVRYFDIYAHFQQYKGTEFGPMMFADEIKLVQCTEQHWKNIPGISYSYPIYGVFCPEIGKQNSIYGSIFQGNQQRIKISINKCDDSMSGPSQKPCASAEEMNNLWNMLDGYLTLNFNYLNTFLNPDQQIYKQQYFEGSQYAYIGPTLGSDISVQIADYEIITDESIWPFTDNVVDNGLFIPKGTNLKYFPRNQDYWNYATIQITKSTDKYTYNRTVQKLSSIFSYIGGVISSLLTAFFIMNAYTSFSFQISLANELFTVQKSQKTDQSLKDSNNRQNIEKQNEKKEDFQDDNREQLKLGILVFLKYRIFRFFKEKINKVSQWNDMNFIDQHHRQMTKQLDIKRLMKRIIFLQHCINKTFDRNPIKQLVHTQPNSLQEIKNNRVQLDQEEQAHQNSDKNDFVQSKKQNSQLKKSRQSMTKRKKANAYNLFDQISGNSIIKTTQNNLVLNQQIIIENKQIMKQVQLLSPTLLFPQTNYTKNNIRTNKQKRSLLLVTNHKNERLDITQKNERQNKVIQEEIVEVPVEISDIIDS